MLLQHGKSRIQLGILGIQAIQLLLSDRQPVLHFVQALAALGVLTAGSAGIGLLIGLFILNADDPQFALGIALRAGAGCRRSWLRLRRPRGKSLILAGHFLNCLGIAQASNLVQFRHPQHRAALYLIYICGDKCIRVQPLQCQHGLLDADRSVRPGAQRQLPQGVTGVNCQGTGIGNGSLVWRCDG